MPKRKKMTFSSKDCDVKRFKEINAKRGSATPMECLSPTKRDHFGLSNDILSTPPTNVGSIQEFNMCKEEPADYSLRQNESGFVKTMSHLACAFCHSSEETEIYGMMLHYDHGKLVEGDHALQRGVVHVHQKCIDWAPQVYYEKGIARNLEKEVARAARLKCTKCGQKGAPLGCYVESCRKTYHAPCAVQLSDCRWDTENFWLLCPSHFMEPFPSDRSRTEEKVRTRATSTTPLGQREANRSSSSPSASEVKIRNKVILRNNDYWEGSVVMSEKWVLCGSALPKDHRILLTKFAEVTGASVCRAWEPGVTHLITATDELGACRRTLEYLMAILSGKWILKIEWIKACLEAKCYVAEVNYEVFHDVHGFFGGPICGRMRVIEKAPPLFKGLSFYFIGHFDPSYKSRLVALLSAAGGTILKEIGMPSCGLRALVPSTLIVYKLDTSGDQADQGGIIKEANILAARTGFRVVAHTWIVDSIAACEIQG